MPMFSLKRHPIKDQVAVFGIQSSVIALPMSCVVARQPWSGGRQHITTGSSAVGYTSHAGNLVPVYDLSAALGLPQREVGSEEVAIILTAQGYVAVQVDQYFGSQQGSPEQKHFSADDMLEMIVKSSLDEPHSL